MEIVKTDRDLYGMSMSELAPFAGKFVLVVGSTSYYYVSINGTMIWQMPSQDAQHFAEWYLQQRDKTETISPAALLGEQQPPEPTENDAIPKVISLTLNNCRNINVGKDVLRYD